MRKLIFISAIVILIVHQSNAATCPLNLAKPQTGFIENKGQFTNAERDVLYVYHGDGFSLVLRKAGFSYQLFKDVPVAVENLKTCKRHSSVVETDEELIAEKPERSVITNIDVSFVNAFSNIRVEATDPYSFYMNYYTQQIPALYVRTFQRVTYYNVYNDIDLTFYFRKGENNESRLVYDWLIHSNGNAKDIALNYDGAKAMKVRADGSLILEQEIGFITEGKPLIVVKNSPATLATAYSLNGNTIRFNQSQQSSLGEYAIDPDISWGFYVGGKKKELPDEMAVDAYSNIYIAGRIKSHDLYWHGVIVTGNSDANDLDAFLAKFDANANLIWWNYFGSTGEEKAYALCIDPVTQEPFLGGRTNSKTGIAYACDDTTDYKTQSAWGGRFDGFVAKFTVDGILIRSTYVGGENGDYFLGIGAYKDENGNVWLYGTGYTESPQGIVRPSDTSVAQYTYSGGDSVNGDIFVIKFNGDLSERIWGSYYGKMLAQERGHGVVADKSGNVYVQGTLSGSFGGLSKGKNIYQKKKGKKGDAFLAKWRPDGTLEWFTYYGGDQYDRGRAIAMDEIGNIYFCGATSATKITAWPSAMASSADVIKPTAMNLSEDKDGFIAKFNQSGQRIWGTYFGGANYEYLRSISVGPLGAAIYVGGYAKSADLPTTPDAYYPTVHDSGDYFFAKINYSATKILYCSYYGGSGQEGTDISTLEDWYGGVIAVDYNTRDIYISSGTTSQSGIDPTCDSNCIIGNWDVFLVKFADPCGVNSDAFEPNNNRDGKVPLLAFNSSNNILIPGVISHPENGADDVDYFSFVPPKGKGFLTAILSQPPDADYFLTPYDNDGALISFSGRKDSISFEADDNESCYLKVAAVSGYNDSSCYSLLIIAGDETSRIKAQSSLNKISAYIYPNPATQTAHLQVQNCDAGKYELSITDMTNREVFHRSYYLKETANSIQLDLQQIPAGVYSVVLKGNAVQKELRFVVVR